MTTIKEMAQNYVPAETKNIAELEKVSVNIEIAEVEYTKEDGKVFTINEAEIEGEKYRVPVQVLKQLKGLLEKFPDTSFFSVSKTGEGLKTQYQVFPA